MSTEQKLEAAVEEIIALNAALAGAKATLDDITVQLRFWRLAAEHAVNGWNALEEKYESLLESARNAELCLHNTLARVEPPAPASQMEFDFGGPL